ncbi:hypothetical protein B0T24DRAFT_696847 [Lasiosphaeria ovina]|uniref:Ricin B lectin domain-containing protein n=1 Tax=Lasiosphaeria ovina TaxID=92902 RepID=A0AAE0TUM4_9PEZI|nr:hypothetical protein B0T24DRAFT_696847 [Lasiosphaeria ovina]
MVAVSLHALLLACATLASAQVTKLDDAATAEAQKRDDTATRAFTSVQIKTSDGQCLFVDKLSGDFRENLTPIQVGACGSNAAAEGWDVITAGKHIATPGQALIVSSLTNACFNFDDRRKAGNQVLLFSCGGRADGGGDKTNSQAFAFTGSAGPLQLKPQNAAGKCLFVDAATKKLDIQACSNDATQMFTFGAAAAGGNTGGGGNGNGKGNGDGNSAGASSKSASSTSTSAASSAVVDPRASVPAANAGAVATPNGNIPTANPTTPVAVSGARGKLDPTAAAVANKRDGTAKRAFTGVSIKAPNGQCLFIDPTAGDFRQNLIPVSLVTCGGTPNEKWDVITEGIHNKKADLDGNSAKIPSALVVSSLVNGCISFDGRRPAGDNITLFSCGGRGDGEGKTDTGQLFPFIGQTSFALAPLNENNKTCAIPGKDNKGNVRIVSGPCPTNGAQLFSIFQ